MSPWQSIGSDAELGNGRAESGHSGGLSRAQRDGGCVGTRWLCIRVDYHHVPTRDQVSKSVETVDDVAVCDQPSRRTEQDDDGPIDPTRRPEEGM